MNDLNLALIGNCNIGALVNAAGDIVWGCFPRFDGDAVFCSLVQGERDAKAPGIWRVELIDQERTEQNYVPHTAVLTTTLYDKSGGIVELTDFAPRFLHHGRIFCPMTLVRRLKRIAGCPRVRITLLPAGRWGEEYPQLTFGPNHIRYLLPNIVLRLTTNASITAILQQNTFLLEEDLTLILGSDETVPVGIEEQGRRYEQETIDHWRVWVRGLAIPFEWQEVVIRAAISLKQNAFEDTGAIIAAMTTSIPESDDGSGRNWDYRFCWLRDAYFTLNALNRLGTTATMEQYLSYIINLVGNAEGQLQPVYRIDGSAELTEETVPGLKGYRGYGPVRTGNLAYKQVQNDVYGSAVLAVTHVFFDKRLHRRDIHGLFHLLERMGDMAHRTYDQPDAGLWELRGSARVHTFSAVMCWAACDRLARIALQIGLEERAMHWRTIAERMRTDILARAWNEKRGILASSFGGDGMDASLLLLPELLFIAPDDPRFHGIVKAVEEDLKQGDYIFRYSEADDFGVPQNAFLVCTFWYIDALVAIGRKDEARVLFENMIARRNAHGLFAEHIHPQTNELWGNIVQTYSMVGLINSAMKLSVPWEEAF